MTDSKFIWLVLVAGASVDDAVESTVTRRERMR